MPHRRGLAGLQQGEGALDIGVDVALGVFQCVADAGLGGEVDDHLRRLGVHHLGQACAFGQVKEMRGEAGQGFQLCMARLLQPDIVVGDHGVDAGDGMPGLEQPRGRHGTR